MYLFIYLIIFLFTCSFLDFLCSRNLQEGMDKPPPHRRLGLQAGREPAPSPNLMQKLVTIRVLKIAEKGRFFKCPQGPRKKVILCTTVREILSGQCTLHSTKHGTPFKHALYLFYA